MSDYCMDAYIANRLSGAKATYVTEADGSRTYFGDNVQEAVAAGELDAPRNGDRWVW